MLQSWPLDQMGGGRYTSWCNDRISGSCELGLYNYQKARPYLVHHWYKKWLTNEMYGELKTIIHPYPMGFV